MTTKEAIHRLVEALDEEAAVAVLDYVQALADERRSGNDANAGSDARLRPLEWMKVGQPTSEDDPIWRVVGMVGDEDGGPTEVARNHDRYLADEDEAQHEADERMAEAAPAMTFVDPVWNLVGIGRTAEPTNVAKHKDEYLADAFDSRRP